MYNHVNYIHVCTSISCLHVGSHNHVNYGLEEASLACEREPTYKQLFITNRFASRLLVTTLYGL